MKLLNKIERKEKKSNSKKMERSNGTLKSLVCLLK